MDPVEYDRFFLYQLNNGDNQYIYFFSNFKPSFFVYFFNLFLFLYPLVQIVYITLLSYFYFCFTYCISCTRVHFDHLLIRRFDCGPKEEVVRIGGQFSPSAANLARTCTRFLGPFS